MVRFARRLALALAVLAIGLGTAAVRAPTAAAAGDGTTDQLQSFGAATYELVAARHVIHVTIALTLTNRAPGSSRSHPCTQYYVDPYYGYISYTATCTTKTTYYFNSYTMYVEKDATHVKVTANRGTASARLGGPSGSWRKIALKYSNLNYAQTRKLTVSYDLPAGGPRSTAARRAGAGYANFCAAGPGADKGSLRILVPGGFTLASTSPLKTSHAGSKVALTTGTMKKPWTFYTCVSGSNDTATVTTKVPTAGGSVTIEAWKDDPAFAAAADAVARTGVPKLTQLFGPLGSTDLTIKEHPSATGSDVYVASSATLRLAETTATEEAVLHRVARLWFDEDLFGAGWLRDAYADWAEVASGAGTPPCTEPPTYPGVGEPNLAASHDIGPGATERERSTHTWERQAGCFLVASIADEIGMERMQATIATLRGNGSGFGEAVDATPRHLARDWHSWLDVMEQEGLRPAGAAPDLAARLLRSYGVTFDDAALAKHAQAVEAYLALQKLTGGVVPAPITSALAGWQFDEASAATSAATAAWQAGDAAVATVAGSSADGGPVRAAVLAATTQDELDAAVALAARQQALATDVSAALATAAEPRDAIQQLGLLGTILPANADAVTAVTKLDVDGGTAVAQQIRTVIGAARDIGIQRAAAIGGLLVAVLILLLGAFLLRRRRRRRRASAVTPPVDLAGPPAQA